MKITLVLFAIVLFTDAATVTDDADSPLVSYLLAKLQRLKSKVMARPNPWDNRPVIRSTREAMAESKSVKPRSTPPECKCPLSIVTYVRWGNSTCPYGADTIYSGVAAGSWYLHEGAAVDLLCLPPNPQYLYEWLPKLGTIIWSRI